MHLETAVPLLVPDLPSPQELMPYLQRMHAARLYSNFGPLVCELEQLLAARFQATTPAASVTTASSATLALELALSALELPPGSRVLVPSCSRKIEPGMVVKTDSERVRHSRKMVLEFLDSSTDLSTTPDVAEWIAEYGADADRYGPRG